MSVAEKPVKETESLHNLWYNLGEIHITLELSTFSTGFSTRLFEKSVDKSGVKCNAVTKLKEYEWNEDDDSVIWAPLPDSYLQDVLKEKRALARKISVLCDRYKAR